MLNFSIKSFNDLTVNELYYLLKLRSEVFVVEQDCVYQDIDDKDSKSYHILGKKNDDIIAYARIFDVNDYFKGATSIGRVVVKKSQRKYGYGHMLMDYAIHQIQEKFNTHKITISAQLYLQNFYESHGFKRIGDVYLEDGIPHIRMVIT